MISLGNDEASGLPDIRINSGSTKNIGKMFFVQFLWKTEWELKRNWNRSQFPTTQKFSSSADKCQGQTSQKDINTTMEDVLPLQTTNYKALLENTTIENYNFSNLPSWNITYFWYYSVINTLPHCNTTILKDYRMSHTRSIASLTPLHVLEGPSLLTKKMTKLSFQSRFLKDIDM